LIVTQICSPLLLTYSPVSPRHTQFRFSTPSVTFCGYLGEVTRRRVNQSINQI